AQRLRSPLAAVHTDVDAYPRRPQPLRIEHSEPIARIREEAQLVHEPLRVEGPALAVAGHPHALLPPRVEHVVLYDRSTELEVMPGHALVVHGRRLLPRRERLDARGHRPPH